LSLQLKVWGCRGSLPTPGPDTVTYGGNTSCVEVLVDGETALVLDAGTGIRALGLDLARRGVRRIHVFLTHLHLDHLEGLRFFAPLWDPDVTVEVWGPRSPVVSLHERILRGFSPPLFPIDFRDVPARIAFHDLPAEPWRTNGVSLSSDLVLHPGPTVGPGWTTSTAVTENGPSAHDSRGTSWKVTFDGTSFSSSGNNGGENERAIRSRRLVFGDGGPQMSIETFGLQSGPKKRRPSRWSR